jgi:hypothetical protein
MKHILLFILLSLSGKSFSQGLAFYLPNGQKLPPTLTTIKKVLDSLGVEHYTTYSHKLGDVYMTELYKKPVFVMLWDKKHPEYIKQILAIYSQKKSEYLNSYDYWNDLDDLRKANKLTDEFISDTFGSDSYTAEKLGFDSTRVFMSHNCSFDYRNGSVVGVNIDNYMGAILKHHLLIKDYKVAGGDYSIGFSISLANFGPKDIKYIYFSTVAKNPVKDIVGRKVFTGVGPVEKGATVSFEFEDGYYSRTASSLSIESIRMLYFDGTQKVLTKPMVQAIMHTNYEDF